MLTNHPLLAGKLVHAWTEPAMRAVDGADDGMEPTRFRLVVDESDDVLGAVSDKYRLVRNADLVAALDLEAEKRGLVLEPTRAAYRNGRSMYSFQVPSLEFRAGSDPSVTTPQVVLKNDYRGGGGLHVQSGYYRQICTNGAVRGTVAHYDSQRHVGTFSLPKFVAGALDRLVEIFEVDRVLAETLAATAVPASTELVEKLIADTAKRYQPDVERAVRENVAAIGSNAWAYMQAVAEVATHRMQERANFNFAADAWATRMVRVIGEHVEVEV